MLILSKPCRRQGAQSGAGLAKKQADVGSSLWTSLHAHAPSTHPLPQPLPRGFFPLDK